MALNLQTLDARKMLLKQIKSNENIGAKQESLRAQEIWFDRIDQYVREYLKSQFSEQTVKNMPVVSSINLAKRIVKQESSIYRNRPDRDFSDLSDEQKEVVNKIYNDLKADTALLKSNQSYKYYSVTHFQVVPFRGKLISRDLLRHHIDAIPDPENPEDAIGYVISSFDKSSLLTSNKYANQSNVSGSMPNRMSMSDLTNQKIGDSDDYKSTLERYVVWTKDYDGEIGLNFIMDGNGNLIGEMKENPLRVIDPSLLPIVKISDNSGTFEYWPRQGQNLADFTVQFCGQLSDLQNIVRMQGWAQAIVSGDANLMPETLSVGPTTVLKLPIDPQNPVPTTFEYVSPNPDLAGSLSVLESTLAFYLSSRGVDPKVISGKLDANRFSSGVERLLHLIEKFEASQEDIALFESKEDEIYTVIKAWHNISLGTDLLNSKYQTSALSDESEVFVDYKKPELIQTRSEKIESIERELGLGTMSRVDALMELKNLTREQAEERKVEIDEDEGINLQMPMENLNGENRQPDIETNGSESNIQS